MADTTEMLRLMRHAANRLAEEHPERIQVTVGMSFHNESTRQLLSLTVAIRQAEMVLRMVAACMADEPTPAPVVPPVTPDPDLPATPDVALTADGRAALTQDLQRMARDRRLAADADLTRHRLLSEHREDRTQP